MTSFPVDAVVYFPDDRWWTAIFMPGSAVDLHVDIGRPFRIKGDQIRTVDLDLDVIRRDGEIGIVDVDEFEAHRVRYDYSADTVAAAQRTADDVARLVRSHRFPFDGTSDQMRTALSS